MVKILFTNRVKIASWLLCLCAAPALAGTESKPLPSNQVPHMASQVTRPPRQAARPTDDFAGLTLTEEQKVKVDQIHQEIRSRMEIVSKDPAENKEQKGAMLEGLARMERTQIYEILTPEQKAEVRKKIIARHAVEKAKSQTPPRQLQIK